MVSTNEIPTAIQKYESWEPKFRWCPDLGAIFPQDIFPACEPDEISTPQNPNSSVSSIATSPDNSCSSVEPKTRRKKPISTCNRVLRSAIKSGISNKSRTNEQMTESLSNINLNESTWSDLEL